MKNLNMDVPVRTRLGPQWHKAFLLIVVLLLFKMVKINDRVDWQKRSVSVSVSVADFSFNFGLNRDRQQKIEGFIR